MKRWIWILVSIAGVAVAALFGIRMPASQSELEVFFTATANGNLEPCGCPVVRTGGLPRRASYIDENSDPAVARLLIDGGDFVGPPSTEGFIQTDYLFQAMHAMGYSVLGLGAKDFAFGIEFLMRAQEHYGFTLTSANVVHAQTGEPVFEPYAFTRAGSGSIFGIPFGGIRIGIVSVMGTDIEPMCVPCTPNIEVVDPVMSARMAVAEIRSESDIVVVLASTPVEQLLEIADIPGIDIAIAARTHHIPPGMSNVGLHGNTVVGFTGYQARRIGYMHARIGNNGIESVVGDLISLGPAIPDRPDIARIVDRYLYELEQVTGDESRSD